MNQVKQAERTVMTIDGLRVAETVLGDGKPVVLLHGWGANIDLMLPLAQRLAPLGYRCYLLDLPGFGQTEAPELSWGVYDYAKFVIAYLDYHGLECVHLFGHSFGGRLGLILGADYPERIRKMALADSAGVRPKASFSTQARLATYKFIRDGLTKIGMKGLSEKLRGWYNGRYASADYQAAGALRETFVRVVNEDLLPYAARVQASTLLFWGDQDEDTPLWQGKLLEQTIPDAGLIVFEGAGHYSYLDKLGDTARIVDHFFSDGG
jgi:pimeloyl-ACP methyl ester carboxylesterase